MTGTREDRLDRTFAALAHPIRRAILSRLARGEAPSVSELAEPFSVSLMAVSRHLSVLEEADLVRREKDGRIRRCSFDPRGMRDASGWIEAQRRFWETGLENLAAYLEAPGRADSDPDPEGDAS